MRIHQSIAPVFFLLTFVRITKGAAPPSYPLACESEDGKIGWCMNQYNSNDRLRCPLRFNDWAEPEEGDCPNDEDVSKPSGQDG